MTIQNAQVGVPVLFSTTGANCQSSCDSVCPDFTLKRHDTYPPFRVSAQDCSGPLPLTDKSLILEVSMWTHGKLKADLTNVSTDPKYSVFQLAGHQGFDQIMINDIIVMHQARVPEQMLIIGFDEADKYIYVQRGYHGTPIAYWKKGTHMRIFRTLNATAPQTAIEEVKGTEIGIDGSTKNNVLKGTYLVYNWGTGDTCLAGCYMLEFKLIKMTTATTSTSNLWWPTQPVVLNVDPDVPGGTPFEMPPWEGNWPQWNGLNWNWPQWSGDCWAYPSNMPSYSIPSFSIPSVPSLSPTTGDYGCDVGSGVEWVRRFPVNSEGFIIRVVDSPTSENIY